MLTNPRYIVIFKDSPNARIEYYGPFASVLLALEFQDRLPEPLKGGMKTYKALRPHNIHQLSAVTTGIIRRRMIEGDIRAA